MTTKIKGELEIDHERGVIYFHGDRSGISHLRICNLPRPIPKIGVNKKLSLEFSLLDVTYKGHCSWEGQCR